MLLKFSTSDEPGVAINEQTIVHFIMSFYQLFRVGIVKNSVKLLSGFSQEYKRRAKAR
jgi:hypothetical protein